MAIYKVQLNGEVLGQHICNNLFYRTGVGIDLDGLTVGGAAELAAGVKDKVWSKMKASLPSSYTLQDITVYPFHDGSFDLMFQNPYTLNVGESATANMQTDGPAQCAIIKFNLEPTTILPNGVKPPKRGYVAFGPISSSAIDDSGHIVSEVLNDPMNELMQVAKAMSENIENLLPPVIWYPIRVHQDSVLGLLKITSFADISGASVRRLASFRRSRMAER